MPRRRIASLAAIALFAIGFTAASQGKPPNPTTAKCNPAHPCTTTGATTTPGVYTVPGSIDYTCTTDDTQALLAWIATVPNNSTLQFGTGRCYRIEGTLELTGRAGLTIDGGGSTFRSFNPLVSGNSTDSHRSIWRINNSTGMVFRNMTVQGSYANGGTLDPTLQWAYAIELNGTHADISFVTLRDVGGDGVLFYLYGSTPSSGSVTDSTILRTGRNAVSFVAANGVLVQRLTTDVIGYSPFDIEPNVGQTVGVSNVTVDSNTVGSYDTVDTNAYGILPNAPISNITISGNHATLGRLASSTTGLRPQYVTVINNVSANPTTMGFNNMDHLTVSGNGANTQIIENGCT